MDILRRQIHAIAALACMAAHASACDGLPLTVNAPDAAIHDQTCAAAIRLLPQLARCGVVPSQPLTVTVTHDLPDAPTCLGLYHCGTQQIEILSPDGIEVHRSDRSIFREIPSPRYFESVLAHEMTHAAYDAVPCPYPECLLTSEYVSYAMQIFTLSDADRATVEADIDMTEKVGRDAINTITLLMDADRFASRVWSHFSQRPDGCRYVIDMMAARFYLDTERP